MLPWKNLDDNEIMNNFEQVKIVSGTKMTKNNS